MAKLSEGQFKGLWDDLALGAPAGEGGGFTVNADTLEPVTEGIMVSSPVGEEQVPQSEATPARLKKYRESNDFSAPYNNFGGWNPGGDADVSLDRSRQVLPDRKVAQEYGDAVARADSMTTALDLGIANQQEAVFRFDDFSTPRTGLKREDLDR